MVEILAPRSVALDPRPVVEWLRSPSRPALQIASALDRSRRAPSILEAMRSRDALLSATAECIAAGVRADQMLDPIREAIADPSDTVTGLAAVHALALVPGRTADDDLAGLIFDAQPGFEEHAAWAAAGRSPTAWLVDTLSGALLRRGVTGMHAQSALARWARNDAATVLEALQQRLIGVTSEAARRRIVETIGLVPGATARLSLERVASDHVEADPVRVTAIAAFVERSTDALPRSFSALARESGSLGRAVRLTRTQRHLILRGPRRAHDRSDGIRVAQIHLGAVLDASMSRAGMGDTGGVATLLSRLGSSLAAQPRVAEVVSIGRTTAGAATVPGATMAGHRFDSVPLEDGEGATFASPWPSIVAAQRGIRSALLATGVPDVIHLRMADPGSLAGALVAQQLGIPTVFTLAPDPHGPIADAERRGELTRADFAGQDALAALWFRVDLVARLAAQAREVVLFPRAEIAERLTELVGIDISAGPPRYTIVAEGVDTHRSDTAATALGSETAPAILAALDSELAALPPQRHGLPLAVTVGRMHEMKGMARVVAAFATDSDLAVAANLVIIGGDLSAPTPAEMAELDRIEAILDREPGLRERVVLLGHRPNDDVAIVLAAAQAGWGKHIGAGGSYVSGSRKEEFGLAIVEAMAAGLPVVAPLEGGPASYVEPGRTGELVDTSDSRAIATGLRLTLGLAADRRTAKLTREAVEDRYTIDRMARTLAAVYRVSTGASTLSLPVAEASAA